MRIPNLSVSENVTETIRRLDRQRLELEQQISDGQKITLPEDDGMRMGRVIKLDTEKNSLSQYQRNASYATEYLNASHLNLDKLREVSVRAQEIARVAGSGLTESAMETYGFEVEQLIEEALNRVNSSHRNRSLFAGTETTPKFANTKVKLGDRVQKTISLNNNLVGHYSPAGNYSPNNPNSDFKVIKDDKLVVTVNGRQFELTSNRSDLTTEQAAHALANAINTNPVNFSPVIEDAYSIEAFGDFKDDGGPRVTANVTANGDLLLVGGVGRDFDLSAQYRTYYDNDFYLNEGTKAKLEAESAKVFSSAYSDLDPRQKQIITEKVLGSNWKAKFDEESFSTPKSRFTPPENIFNVGSGYDVSETAPLVSIVGEDKGTLEATATINPDGTLNIYFTGSPSGGRMLNLQVAEGIVRPPTSFKEGIANANFDPDGPPLSINLDGTDKGTLAANVSLDSSGQLDISWNGLPSGKGEFVLRVEQGDVWYEQTRTGLWGYAFDQVVEGVENPEYQSGQNAKWKAMLDEETAKQFPGKQYDDLTTAQQIQVDENFLFPSWERELAIKVGGVSGSSNISIEHPTEWKRLSRYEYGDLVNHDGKTWRSRNLDGNWNHKPGDTDVTNWEEVPGDYSVGREDWKLTVTDSAKREFWITPDGKLFDAGGVDEDLLDLELAPFSDKSSRVPPKHLARRHTLQILGISEGSLPSPDGADAEARLLAFEAELDKWVKRVTIEVPQFTVEGSESRRGLVSFDSQTQEYYMSTPGGDGEIVSGSFFKGSYGRENASAINLDGTPTTITTSSHQKGDLILREGIFYMALGNVGKNVDISGWKDLTETSPPSDTVTFDPSAEKSVAIVKGRHLYEPESQQYYIANKDVTLPPESTVANLASNPDLQSVTFRRDGSSNAFLLGKLPVDGEESIYIEGRPLSLKMGEYVYVANDKDAPNRDDDPDDAYGENDGFFYVATENITLGEKDASGVGVKPKDLLGKGLEKVPGYSVEQGADWSFSKRYDKGQIVHYNGQYFQCLRDGWSNLSTDPQSQTNNEYVVFPSDESFHDEGILVSNSAWLPVEKPLDHVLKFSVTTEEAPKVTFPSSGADGGESAKAEVVVDADGYIAGVRVVDPGRYFFGTSSAGETVPPSFDYAKVVIPGGDEMNVRILWTQDPTGPYKVAGFDFENEKMISGALAGPQKGDSYSFATGTKTFLEHRAEDGSIADIAYNGSDKNSEFYIGHNSKISSTLDAKDKGTEELGDVVSALVDLREAFRNAEPSGYAEEVEIASQKLISLEGRVVDKMGELSSKMVRMDVVKAHDEDYFLELNSRLSRDLDVDLSEAIIRMMRASTAYQASLQVGAQLMNTSLLNYI